MKRCVRCTGLRRSRPATIADGRPRAAFVVLLFAASFGFGCLPDVTAPPARLDTEFDDGSRIAARELSSVQVENLVLLGKVWGFAKYHHPRVTAGQVNWDYALFRVMPQVLDAKDRAAAAGVISAWLGELGEVRNCTNCASPPVDAQLQPDIAWIDDVPGLGAALSTRLRAMHRNRSVDGAQYYVSLVPAVQNPNFTREAVYPQFAEPDAGYRVLALFRFWNIIQYWFPYRDVMEEDWDAVLRQFVLLVMRPMTGDEYRLAMIQLAARVHDTHANVWSELHVQPPLGTMQLPVVLRFIEGQAVVTGYSHAQRGPETGLQIGDVIETIDGDPVASLVAAWRPYYPASNEPTRLRDIARNLTRGMGPALVSGLSRDGAYFQFTALRVPRSLLDPSAGRSHDLPGPAFQLLSDDVAYIKLPGLVPSEIAGQIEQALGRRVLVIDIRNYPTSFVPFALGGHLVGAPTPFVRFTAGSLTNPGAIVWSGPPLVIAPLAPRFTGQVVILVDEVTQSSAEYHAMAFRASPNAIVVGSTTAGADGNVSRIPLPGGIESMISGIGVFYPDGRPTQRIGIVPDLVVRPTIAGIRAGRDEVLEAAVSHALRRPLRHGELSFRPQPPDPTIKASWRSQPRVVAQPARIVR